jgi:hypothetical protein
MEKRVTFKGWLPYLLVAPQLLVTFVFFFWPAGQAIWQSPSSPIRSGSMQFVGLGNFEYPARRPASIANRLPDHRRLLGSGHGRLDVVCALAGGSGRPAHQGIGRLSHASDLALCRGAGGGRRAVAVHVQHPRRHGRLVSRQLGYDWNHV